MADTCDVCGGDAKSFGPRGRRCLACLAADDPALRSDVPAVSRDPVRPCVDCGAMGQWGPFTCCDPCWDKAHPKAPDIDVRPPPLPIGEPERRLWRQRVAVALILQVEAERVAAHDRACADAAHAALDATTERLAEVERILERYGAVGCDAALRVIRGEPIVRERTR